MNSSYIVTLKSGVTTRLTPVDATKNLIGLWIYLSRKVGPEFISFVEATVNVQEIAMIEAVEELDLMENNIIHSSEEVS